MEIKMADEKFYLPVPSWTEGIDAYSGASFGSDYVAPIPFASRIEAHAAGKTYLRALTARLKEIEREIREKKEK